MKGKNSLILRHLEMVSCIPEYILKYAACVNIVADPESCLGGGGTDLYNSYSISIIIN